MTHATDRRHRDRALGLNRARRLGYRILPGDTFSYILHLRPREWPIMAAHTALGAGLATTAAGSAAPVDAASVALGLLLWVVALNGGTLALNSAFDDDEGDIGYLDAPPPPPRHLATFAAILLLGGQLLALALTPLFAIAYAICFLMSILYSVPPFRWKAIAGADWIINMLGFGTLTPLAGWAATGRPLEPWALLALLAFCPLFAGFYPLTQLYQLDEDRARGDHTLALALGVQRSLQITGAATAIAFLLLTAALALGPANRAAPLLALPAAAWAAVLIPWYRRHARMTAPEHQRGMYAALRAWALTDIVVFLAFL